MGVGAGVVVGFGVGVMVTIGAGVGEREGCSMLSMYTQPLDTRMMAKSSVASTMPGVFFVFYPTYSNILYGKSTPVSYKYCVLRNHY